MNTEESPLLSVAVYTYNQENFVKETLDSLLPNGREADGTSELLKKTELIVSDDCSSDGTTGTVKEWMERYGNVFSVCRLISGERNEGPVRNYTRAVRACTGEIVKPLAGDDLFSLKGLSAAVLAMFSQPDVSILFGQVVPFKGTPRSDTSEWTAEQRRFFASEVSVQFRTLVSFDPLPAPGVLFRRELFERLRLWEHDFFWMEDWPLWLLATANGYRVHALDLPVVFYRIHTASLSQRMNTKGRERVRRGINEDRRKMYDDIVFSHIDSLPLLLRHHVRLRRFFFAWLERTGFPGLVHWVRSLSLIIDPYRMGRKIRCVFAGRT